MAVQKRNALFAAGKQTAKGTALSNPTYEIGVRGGHVVSTDISEDDLDTTWTTRVLESADRKGVVPGFDVEGVLTPAFVGLLLNGTLGVRNTTGAGPYVHTFSPSLTDGDLPYHTVFAKYGDEDYKIRDVKFDELEIEWEQTSSLKFKANGMGTNLSFPQGTDEVQTLTINATGGTFTISVETKTTSAIAYNANAAAIQSALNALTNVESGDIVVTGTGPFTLTFGGRYSDKDVPALTTDASSLTGGTSTAAITTPTPGVGASYTPSVSERVLDGTFKTQGGTFLIFGEECKMKKGSIKIKNNLEAVILTNVEPDDIVPGMVECEINMTVVPNDLRDFRRALTGTTAGTSTSAEISTGAVDFTFVSAAGQSLQFTSTRCKMLSEMPSADPKGGPVEVEISGMVLATSSGNPFQLVLTNSVASY